MSHNETGNTSNIQIEEDSEEEFDIPWAVAVEKRIAQNLENVDFDDDSDDDTEWAPTPEDILLVDEDESNPAENEQPGNFSCTECDFDTKYEFSLIRHTRCHDRASIKRKGDTLVGGKQKKVKAPENENAEFRCSECGTTFSRKGNLKRHCLNKHNTTLK